MPSVNAAGRFWESVPWKVLISSGGCVIAAGILYTPFVVLTLVLYSSAAILGFNAISEYVSQSSWSPVSTLLTSISKSQDNLSFKKE